MKIVIPFKRTILCLLSLCLSSLASVQADELDIYYQNSNSIVSPNVMFVLDFSGSMLATETAGATRMQSLQDSFRSIMYSAPKKLNVGFMHYADAPTLSWYGWASVKGVNVPIQPIDSFSQTVLGSGNMSADNLPDAGSNTLLRDYLADMVSSASPEGYTPIVDSLSELHRYWNGDEVRFGIGEPNDVWAAHASTYSGSMSCSTREKTICNNTLGECTNDIVQNSCETEAFNNCCNWVDTTSGSYCQNNDYSCRVEYEFCEHNVCTDYTSDANYIRPSGEECQLSYNVIMSDGFPEYPHLDTVNNAGTNRYPKSVKPNKNYGNSTGVAALLPSLNETDFGGDLESLVGIKCADSPGGYASGTCGPEILEHMSTTDMYPDVDGDQVVDTFTIAYGLLNNQGGQDYVASLATPGGGAFTADNSQDLVDAFEEIFQKVQDNSFSFATPTFATNPKNVLSSGQYVYMPVFDFSYKQRWQGNIRKFKLNSQGEIVDANGVSPFDENRQLKDSAQDLWSSAPHGKNVAIGGAASKIPHPTLRKIYTDGSLDDENQYKQGQFVSRYSLPYHTVVSQGGVSSSSEPVSCSGWYYDCNGNRVRVDGDPSTNNGCVDVSQVTSCRVSSIAPYNAKMLKDFLYGYQHGIEGNTQRFEMGDMINSKPLLFDYGNGNTRLFVGTNEGLLHAIDADSGSEKWAWAPENSLRNLKQLIENKRSEKHLYGVDGHISVWFNDVNGNGVVESDDNDFVYLYFGLGRGGRQYYALDITKPDEPSLAWQIEYSEMGQTWSQLTRSKMRVGKNGDLRDVLVFGGGYDPAKDEANYQKRAADQTGRDVFIVDAKTGELIWSLRQGDKIFDTGAVFGSEKLKHSIPGDIRVLDMDSNGALDRLYFADTGGNVWRVDMDADVYNTSNDTVYDYSKATLHHFAELGYDDPGVPSGDHRMFFAEPDVSLQVKDGEEIMLVSIGSGHRSRPLNTAVQDRFFVLEDIDPFKTFIGTADPIIFENLVSRDTLISSNVDNFTTEFVTNGWYIDLDFRAEKSTTTSLTFRNLLIFNTHADVGVDGLEHSPAPCVLGQTSSRSYVLDILSGQASADLDRDPANGNDTFVVSGVNEIIDSPQITFSAPFDPATGNECTASSAKCSQETTVQAGKLELPLVDTVNVDATQGSNGAATDISNVTPGLFWVDVDVSDN